MCVVYNVIFQTASWQSSHFLFRLLSHSASMVFNWIAAFASKHSTTSVAITSTVKYSQHIASVAFFFSSKPGSTEKLLGN